MSAPSFSLDELLAQRGFVLRLARRLVADEGLAEDLVQNAYLTALQRPPQDGRNLRAWLVTTLRRGLLRGRRAEARRCRHERARATAAEAPATDELAAELQLHRELLDAVEALPEIYRRVVFMRYFQDLPPREIARELGAPVATVNSQLSRALQLLRGRLDQAHGGDRKAWCLPLALSLRPATTLLGLGALTMKIKLTAALALLVALGLYFYQAVPGRGAAAPVAAAATAPAVAAASPEKGYAETTASQRQRLAAAAPGTQPSEAKARAETRLEGLVLDVAGQPLAGVGLGFRADQQARFESAADGRFSLRPPEQAESLWVRDPAYATVLRAELAAGDAPGPATELILIAGPRLELAGRVWDESGQPVPGAEITWQLPADFRARIPRVLDTSRAAGQRCESDAQGRFRLPPLGRVPGAGLLLRAGGFLPLLVPLPEQSRADLRLVLQRPKRGPGSLQGQVLDALGQPVAGAMVGIGRAVVPSAADGRFVLPLREAPGARRLRAMKRGFQPASYELDAAQPGEGPDSFIYLRLGPSSLELSGQLVDGAGRPLPGQRICIADPEMFGVVDQGFATMESYLGGGLTNSELRRRLGGERSLAELRAARGRFPSLLLNYAVTDAAGRFVLGGLAQRRYRLLAVDPQSLVSQGFGPFEAGSAGLVLRRDRGDALPPLRGVVVSRDGTPLAGIRLSLKAMPVPLRYADARWKITTGQEWAGAEVRTDAAGRFSLPAVGARARLECRGEAVLTRVFGGLDGGLLDALPGPPTALRIVLSRRMRLRIELADPDEADAFSVLGSDGKPRSVHSFGGRMVGRLSAGKIHAGRSAVYAVGEDVRTVILLKGGQEQRRVRLQLAPGLVNVLR